MVLFGVSLRNQKYHIFFHPAFPHHYPFTIPSQDTQNFNALQNFQTMNPYGMPVNSIAAGPEIATDVQSTTNLNQSLQSNQLSTCPASQAQILQTTNTTEMNANGNANALSAAHNVAQHTHTPVSIDGNPSSNTILGSIDLTTASGNSLNVDHQHIDIGIGHESNAFQAEGHNF